MFSFSRQSPKPMLEKAKTEDQKEVCSMILYNYFRRAQQEVNFMYNFCSTFKAPNGDYKSAGSRFQPP